MNPHNKEYIPLRPGLFKHQMPWHARLVFIAALAFQDRDGTSSFSIREVSKFLYIGKSSAQRGLQYLLVNPVAEPYLTLVGHGAKGINVYQIRKPEWNKQKIIAQNPTVPMRTHCPNENTDCPNENTDCPNENTLIHKTKINNNKNVGLSKSREDIDEVIDNFISIAERNKSTWITPRADGKANRKKVAARLKDPDFREHWREALSVLETYGRPKWMKKKVDLFFFCGQQAFERILTRAYWDADARPKQQEPVEAPDGCHVAMDDHGGLTLIRCNECKGLLSKHENQQPCTPREVHHDSTDDDLPF